MTTPDGAACYFCLGEEADEEGMPLVRDCSCRGDSAGFVHFSCLVMYAEQKSKQADEGDMDAFTEPWEKCTNCKQPFMGQLSVDVASDFVSFAEATYGHEGSNMWDKMNVLAALRTKIEVLQKFFAIDKSGGMVERDKLISTLLSMVDQTKKDFNMGRWANMPTGSDEYKYYRRMCGNYEAFVYECLGMPSLDFTEKSVKSKITHLKKALVIYNLFGMTESSKNVESSISSIVTISAGMCYGMALWENGTHIEGERLITKLSTTSRRVLGPGHKITIESDQLLKDCKTRYVIAT